MSEAIIRKLSFLLFPGNADRMYVDELRDFCLSFPEVEECMPFGPNNLVFKRKLRIFLLVGLEDHPIRFNVKCDPEKAIALREEYPESIFPGYHMNKKHWNTVYVDGRLTDSQLHEFIRHSYELVKK